MKTTDLTRRNGLNMATSTGAAIALALLCASNASGVVPKVAPQAPAGTAPVSRTAAGSPDRVLLLAIDDVSLPLRKSVCLYLSKPTVRAEPVLVPSPLESTAPDNLAAHFYGTVLHDAGKFRMWYYACHRGQNPDWPPRKMQQVARKPGWLKGVAEGHEITQGPLCYAESDDGIRFREPAPGHVFIHRDQSPATPVPGHDFNTILCQGNGILNVGDQTRIYHGRWRNVGQKAADIAAYYRGEVALATLPRDRWGAIGLNPGTSEGTVCSAPLALPTGGCEILLNADVASVMRVELLDEQFKPLAGFCGADSGTLDADGGLDCLVKWPKADMASLAGWKVRLVVHLKKAGDEQPRLYAISVRTKGARPR